MCFCYTGQSYGVTETTTLGMLAYEKLSALINFGLGRLLK